MKNQHLLQHAIFGYHNQFQLVGYKRDIIDNIDFSFVRAVVSELWIYTVREVG